MLEHTVLYFNFLSPRSKIWHHFQVELQSNLLDSFHDNLFQYFLHYMVQLFFKKIESGELVGSRIHVSLLLSLFCSFIRPTKVFGGFRYKVLDFLSSFYILYKDSLLRLTRSSVSLALNFSLV